MTTDELRDVIGTLIAREIAHDGLSGGVRCEVALSTVMAECHLQGIGGVFDADAVKEAAGAAVVAVNAVLVRHVSKAHAEKN